MAPPAAAPRRNQMCLGRICTQQTHTAKAHSAIPTSPVPSSSVSLHGGELPLRSASRAKSPLSPAPAGMTLRHRSPVSIPAAPSAPKRATRP